MKVRIGISLGDGALDSDSPDRVARFHRLIARAGTSTRYGSATASLLLGRPSTPLSLWPTWPRACVT